MDVRRIGRTWFAGMGCALLLAVLPGLAGEYPALRVAAAPPFVVDADACGSRPVPLPGAWTVAPPADGQVGSVTVTLPLDASGLDPDVDPDALQIWRRASGPSGVWTALPTRRSGGTVLVADCPPGPAWLVVTAPVIAPPCAPTHLRRVGPPGSRPRRRVPSRPPTVE